MKTLTALLLTLTVGVLLAAPSPALADHKVTVYRDHDGDGHYNKRTFDVSHDHGHDHDHDHYYGGYYGGYYPHSYPYYRPYYAPFPSVTIYSHPSYYSSAPSYGSGDLAVDVQRELRRRGYYHGEIDGDVGPGTRAAIRAYQYDRRLEVTGRIDRSLIHALDIG